MQLPTAFSRDGTRLAYFQPDGNPQIWSVPIEADSGGLKAGKPERFLTTKYHRHGRRRFLLTAGGLPTCRTSRGDSRCMSGRLPRAGRPAANDG